MDVSLSFEKMVTASSSSSAIFTNGFEASKSNNLAKLTSQPFSSFHEAACEIAECLEKTNLMMTRLTSLIKRQGLFDNTSDEVGSLIFRIKQDLDSINHKCDSAQLYIDELRQNNSNDQQINMY